MNHDEEAYTFVKSFSPQERVSAIYSKPEKELLKFAPQTSANDDTQDMSEITRAEFDAKLETMEVKMDSRVASIEAKISSMESKIDGFVVHMSDRMGRIEQGFDDVKRDSKNLKYWLIGTAIATVIGLYAANISMVQTMVASFESGKNTSVAQADIRKQIEQTDALLKQVQSQVKPPLQK